MRLIALLLVLVVACSTGATAPDGSEVRTITTEGVFSAEECAARGLEGRVLMLESQYCGHCRATKPDFLSACERAGVAPIILDLSLEEDLARAESFGVLAQFTPTFVVDCNYYVGAKDLMTYTQWLAEVNE